jgi:ABC-2 type transport system permease protein
MNLIRAELLKIRTTNTWWVFLLITLPLWGLTLMFNGFQTAFLLDPGSTEGMSPEDAEQIIAASDPANVAANLYTNGQFFGVAIVMLLGAIVVTNEYFHQTVTTTFLTTPHRTRVVLAKLFAASVFGLVLWAITTAANMPAGALIMGANEQASHMGDGTVWRAIALNGLAYLLWAIFGVGFGVLIRSQIGATLTLSIGYVIGTMGASLVFFLLAEYVAEWFSKLQVLVPTTASALMISGTELPGNPPRWVGAAVLIGYAVVTGVVGTLIMKRRDIS